MSSSTPDNAIDELDLADLFSLLKRWAYSALALAFKAIDFLIKFWWIVLALIVIGIVVGTFTMSSTPYKATVIVKTNFDSQPYVYNAIEQLGAKLSDRDPKFISNNKLAGPGGTLLKAEIAPVLDVTSLLEGISATDSRSLSSVLKELSVEDDVELFASDRFYSNYAYHKLEIALIGQEEKYVKRILDYVNNQPVILEIKAGYMKNQRERIAANDTTLSQIDDLINSFTSNIAVVSQQVEKLSFYNNQSNINLNGVLDLKNKLVLETQTLKNDQITATDALVAISDIQIVEDIGLKDKKYIFYPLVLVFIFLFLAGIRFTYKTFRNKLAQENLLD